MRQRRALSYIGGPIRTEGDPQVARTLVEAWETAAREDPNALTFGFHPWPGRMHRAIARVVIRDVTGPRDRVLDPFCGSGTVLLEAMLVRRAAVGVDLNPLAPLLVRTKCERRNAEERARFLRIAVSVGESSIKRVRARERAIAKLPPSMLCRYGPHVLKELAGLLDEIRRVGSEPDRRALEMVFSSLVVKLSNKRAETSDALVVRRIRKGLATELFVRKCEELAERWAALEAALPDGAPEPRVFEGDARDLSRIVGERTKFALVLTSPPYGGTYDYHAQHALRLAWLGLDARWLARAEMGARRAGRVDPDEAAARWDEEVRSMLSAIASVLAPGGACVLVMGDARFGRRDVPVIPQLAVLGPRAGLRMVAVASQPRPSFVGGAPREEHLVAMQLATVPGRPCAR